MSARDLLQAARELSVKVVQIADNLPLDRLASADLITLRREAADSGIALEVGTSGINLPRLRQWLRLATTLESPILRLVLDTREHEPTVEEAVATLQAVVPELERRGVTLAIENHDRFPADMLRQLIELVNSPRVGICFDTANSIGCLESADYVLQGLAPYVVNVHLKDYTIFRPAHNKGFIVEGRPAGQGHLDVPALLQKLRDGGRDSNVIVELWPPPQRTLAESIAMEREWARQSVDYLRTLIPD
jgi:sugar phosphate isomerase/epimerase